jgi:hypothetical protein
MVPFERFLVAAAVLVLASCERTPAQDQHGATNAQQTADASVTGDQHADLDVAWASLGPKVGQYPSQIGLFTKSAVVDDLRALLGEARLQTLQQNFETASPLQRDETVLFTSGNRAHEGGSEAAYLLLDQSHKAIEVGLWTNGTLSVYKTPGSHIRKPADIRTMIANSAAPTPTASSPMETPLARKAIEKLFEGNHVTYDAAFVDLDGDGKQDIVAYASGPEYCGSGGCSMGVLRATGKGYDTIGRATVTQLPIRLLPSRSHGLHDLGVAVSGGGASEHAVRLRFDGRRYPSNPTTLPETATTSDDAGSVLIPSAR